MRNPKYPSNWKRVSRTLRKAVGHCEQCNFPDKLSVHHKGEPYPDGRPGNPKDKHDLRRENLIVLCFKCHDEIDDIKTVTRSFRKMKKRKQAKIEVHRALGIGTGLVPV